MPCLIWSLELFKKIGENLGVGRGKGAGAEYGCMLSRVACIIPDRGWGEWAWGVDGDGALQWDYVDNPVVACGFPLFLIISREAYI